MNWAEIDHPKGLCVRVHVGRSPELVRIGTEEVTDCLACITDACERQRLKWKPWLCDRCRDPGTAPALPSPHGPAPGGGETSKG